MKNLPATLAMILVTAAVAMPANASDKLPLFGKGYPESGDPCRRVGESAYTNKYLDDTRDLVACPEGDPAIKTLTEGRSAEQLETVDGQVLLSVPSKRPGP